MKSVAYKEFAIKIGKHVQFLWHLNSLPRQRGLKALCHQANYHQEY